MSSNSVSLLCIMYVHVLLWLYTHTSIFTERPALLVSVVDLKRTKISKMNIPKYIPKPLETFTSGCWTYILCTIDLGLFYNLLLLNVLGIIVVVVVVVLKVFNKVRLVLKGN